MTHPLRPRGDQEIHNFSSTYTADIQYYIWWKMSREEGEYVQMLRQLPILGGHLNDSDDLKRHILTLKRVH